MRELHRCSRLLAADLAADKDARGIGRELDQGHARISAIKIFILAKKLRAAMHVWGRAPSPVQAEQSSAAARGHTDSGFAKESL